MIEIRSYRRVFDLERRIYSVDRLRLNPGGVPVRAVVYFLSLLLAGLLAAIVPLAGGLVRALPWYLRDLALPGIAATVLSALRLEGRTFHLAAHALLRYRVGPRRLAGARRCRAVGERWRPETMLMLPDGSDARLRDLRYTGPGAVLVAIEHERRGRALELDASGKARPGRRAVLTLRQREGARCLERGEVISLGSGARMRVRSHGSRRG
ncbi:MAG TPA: hypothetical protein VK790_10470 [Solirubrobacteraceae bacterium]|jgi:hypothetical protein|nr:hypothetical protein [Solirubrobacteraceae bacterium]